MTQAGRKRAKRCRSEREARETIRAWLREPPPVPVSRETLTAFADRWLAETVRHTVKPATLVSYEQAVRRHITPALGALPLSAITPGAVQTFQAGLLERYAPGTVIRTLAVLSAIMAEAERHELVTRNPVARVRRPRNPGTRRAAMSADEARAILAAVRGTRIEAAATLALCYGLRSGEACGVRWGDIEEGGSPALGTSALPLGTPVVTADLTRPDRRSPIRQQSTTGTGTVTINGQWTRHGYAPTKRDVTHTFPLLAPVRAALQRQRVRQAADRLRAGREWVDTGYVTTRPDGRPVSHTQPGEWLGRALAGAGLPPRTMHELRHGTASLLAALGVHPSIAQRILGHSTARQTLDTYTAISESQVRAALGALEAVLEG